MKIKDFHLLSNIAYTLPEIECQNYDIKISYSGCEDCISVHDNQITVHNPKKISKTLFNLTYSILTKLLPEETHDQLAVFIWTGLNEYLHHDIIDRTNICPILYSGEKNQTSCITIRQLIQPIIDQYINIYPVLLVKCPYSDPCRVIDNPSDLEHIEYNLNLKSIPRTKYPFILCNSAVNNAAACDSSLLIKQLELNFGETKTQKILKNILLNDLSILRCFINIINVWSVHGSIDYVDDFIQSIKRYVALSEDEQQEYIEITQVVYKHFPTLHKKLAQYTDKNVEKQWTWWGSMLGLIEKQLGAVRGPQYDARINLKPIEDQVKQLAKEYEQKTGKKGLSIEDLLYVIRKFDETKSIGRGKLYEALLQENRVW